MVILTVRAVIETLHDLLKTLPKSQKPNEPGTLKFISFSVTM